MGNFVIRGENFKITYGVESAYGTDPGTGSLVNSFGVVQSATLADPTIDYLPFWGMSNQQYRNWYVAYKGKMALNMSIPDVMLLNGAPLFLPIGKCSVTGSGTYTHVATETYDLPTITVHVTYTDTSLPYNATTSNVLMRRYLGGKVGRATYAATEGGFLTMALDEIQFINMSTNLAPSGSYAGPFYSSGVADVTPVYPTTQPYLFSYGSLKLGSSTFARIREFRLSVDNALEAKYYVTNQAISQLPYEYREGRRTYQLSVTTDIEDASLYKELIRQGTYTSSFTGFSFQMTFTRAGNSSDTIMFSSPATTAGTGGIPTAPAIGGAAMGCLIRSAPHNIVQDPIVGVSLDILCRSLSVTTVDSVSSYSGES
jgi:hypothetical protein